MTLEHHGLLKDFPEHRAAIQKLKTSNLHFANLSEKYDVIDHTIYRIEIGTEVAKQERIEDLKKQRTKLKDELYSMMRQAGH